MYIGWSERSRRALRKQTPIAGKVSRACAREWINRDAKKVAPGSLRAWRSSGARTRSNCSLPVNYVSLPPLLSVTSLRLYIAAESRRGHRNFLEIFICTGEKATAKSLSSRGRRLCKQLRHLMNVLTIAKVYTTKNTTPRILNLPVIARLFSYIFSHQLTSLASPHLRE